MKIVIQFIIMFITLMPTKANKSLLFSKLGKGIPQFQHQLDTLY